MDLLVTTHSIVTQSPAEVVTMDRQHVAGCSRSHIGVLSLSGASIEHLTAHTQQWSKGEMKFTWAGVAAVADVVEIVTRFVRAGAVTGQGKSNFRRVAKHASSADVLAQIHDIAESFPDMLSRVGCRVV